MYFTSTRRRVTYLCPTSGTDPNQTIHVLVPGTQVQRTRASFLKLIKYTVDVFGSSLARGPQTETSTVHARVVTFMRVMAFFKGRSEQNFKPFGARPAEKPSSSDCASNPAFLYLQSPHGFHIVALT